VGRARRDHGPCQWNRCLGEQSAAHHHVNHHVNHHDDAYLLHHDAYLLHHHDAAHHHDHPPR